MLLVDSPPVVFGQVGQRDEAAIHRRVAIVVVFDVKRAAQATRILVDEAEGTLVVATPDTVKRHVAETDAERSIGRDLDLECLAAALDKEEQVAVGFVELKVEDV